MNLITYDGNEKETYSLFHCDKEVAELLISEDFSMALVNDINLFINSLKPYDLIVIQNDNDKLGVIVDVYVKDEHVDGRNYWFEDYKE